MFCGWKICACVAVLVLWTSSAFAQDSCAGRCGDTYDSSLTCQCNTACVSHGDCCSDYDAVCGGGSCEGLCGTAYDASLPCQCNSECDSFSDCCSDYYDLCGGDITDAEIAELGQEIWDADTDRLTVSLNLQGQISDGTTTDAAPNPLFNEIPSEFKSVPIYEKLTAIFNNYIADDSVAEDITGIEWDEVDTFLTEAMNSGPVQKVHSFLASKGVVSSDNTEFQATLKQIWYELYHRDGALSSSGAEHVQVGETQGADEINGLHNWVRFALLEDAGDINYLGYVAIMDFGGTYVIRNPFYWTVEGSDYYKPIGGFFIGTSPSFDLAAYTLCFFARPNSGSCTLTINGNDIAIQTYTLGDNNLTYVGSAYPNY